MRCVQTHYLSSLNGPSSIGTQITPDRSVFVKVMNTSYMRVYNSAVQATGWQTHPHHHSQHSQHSRYGSLNSYTCDTGPLLMGTKRSHGNSSFTYFFSVTNAFGNFRLYTLWNQGKKTTERWSAYAQNKKALHGTKRVTEVKSSIATSWASSKPSICMSHHSPSTLPNQPALSISV